MKFKALRPIRGDYGSKMPGDVFDVPPELVRRMQPLEAAGIIQRYNPTPRLDRKMYTVNYENKAVTPIENKTEKPVRPPLQSRKAD